MNDVDKQEVDKRKWLTPDEVAVKVTEAFEAGVEEGLQKSLANGLRLGSRFMKVNVEDLEKKASLIRKELGALEDRVNDLETALLGEK